MVQFALGSMAPYAYGELHRLLQGVGPGLQGSQLFADHFLRCFVLKVTIVIALLMGGGDEHFRFVERVHIKKYQDLTQVILAAAGAHAAHGGAHDGGGLAGEDATRDPG